MAIGSNVNPNYPIPGIDQSSKGFRDNFSAIKVEIENLQAKNIVLQGDATGNAIIDGGTGDVVINTVVSVANIAAGGTDRSIQFNDAGILNGNSLLYWDPALTLVIGSQSPDTYYWADIGETKIHNELLLEGDSTYGLMTITAVDPNTPVMELRTDSGTANINVSMGALTFSNDGSISAVLSSQGLSIGVGAEPASNRLEINESMQSNVALFHSTLDNSDNTVRMQTDAANSSMGLALQQTAADAVVGIRVGQTGNFTIHTGLNNGAWLSDSSQVVTVDPSGQMGIGIPAPTCRLDVDGGMQWNLPNSADVAPYTVDIIGVVVDSWDMSVYRSADYTVQVTDAMGAIEITKLIVMHEAGAGYQYIYANLNASGGGTGPTTLGTIVAIPNGSMMELTYSGAAMGNTVKVDATYITI